MTDSLLVLNAGSSSIKFALFAAEEEPQPLARGQVSGIGVTAKLAATRADGTPLDLSGGAAQIPDHDAALSLLLDRLSAAGLTDHLAAAGHRVVHGGTRFAAPVVIDRATLEHSLYDVMLDGRSLADTRVGRVHLPLLDVIPATQDLVGAEVELVGKPGREQALRRALTGVRDEYAFVIVDCPPSLGLLTLNVLTAADAVVIPIQCEYYALEGLSQLLNTIKLVQRNFNPALAIDGVPQSIAST